MSERVTIVIPAYNEEDGIGGVIDKIKEMYPDYTVLVIDDGSTDQTADVVRAKGAKVVQHPYNKGSGAAIKTGLRAAKTELVVIIDADGQHDPVEIKKMLEYMPAYDLIVGARTADSDSAWHRDIVNWAYNKLGSYVSEQKILDLTSGFRIFKRSTIMPYINLLPNTFSWPTTSTLSLIKAGYNVKFHPIKASRRIGRSKIKPIQDGLRFFFIIMRIATLFAPFRVFSPISIVFLIAGILYGSYTMLAYERFTNFAQLLMVLFVLIFMLGLIADQIAMLRFTLAGTNETQKPPDVLEDDTRTVD